MKLREEKATFSSSRFIEEKQNKKKRSKTTIPKTVTIKWRDERWICLPLYDLFCGKKNLTATNHSKRKLLVEKKNPALEWVQGMATCLCNRPAGNTRHRSLYVRRYTTVSPWIAWATGACCCWYNSFVAPSQQRPAAHKTKRWVDDDYRKRYIWCCSVGDLWAENVISAIHTVECCTQQNDPDSFFIVPLS